MEYLLTIPGGLDGLNAYLKEIRSSRHKASKMKSDNEAAVICAARHCLHGAGIRKSVYMEYTWYEKDRRRDKDNISSFGRKVIQDALVQAGFLEDDGWDEIAGFSDDFRVDPENPRIEVLIKEVEVVV